MPNAFALVLGFALLLLNGAASADAPPSTGDRQYSDAAQSVMKTRIGPKPSEAFYLADALEAWGLADEARGLRLYLMRRYVKEAAGEAHDARVTVASAIDLGHQQGPLAYGGRDWFGREWARMAAANLRPVFADFAVERPPAIAERSPEARELAPGAWAGRDAADGRSAIFLAAGIENRSAAPVALGAFTLRLEPAPDSGVSRFAFDCPLPADMPVALIPAGGTRSVACVSERKSPGQPSGLARALIHVQAHPERATVTPRDFDGTQSVRPEAVDAHVKALASLSSAKLATLLARFEKCAKDATCGEATPRRDLRKEPVAWAFIAFAVLVVYWFVATFVSNFVAALLTWLGGNGFVYWLISQGPSVKTGESPAGIAYLVIYLALAVVPTVIVAVLYATARILRDKGWWIEPSPVRAWTRRTPREP
ncbi:MAG: hypothetical protein NDI88_00820 [Lysobacter sp.]|nr:hypothetical protein [Lysobacter sp.]